MNKHTLRVALLYAGLSGSFILLDMGLDRFFNAGPTINLAHVIFAVTVVLISFLLLSRALESQRRAESVLRQAREELEIRVNQRTAELQQTNNMLRTLIDTLPVGMLITDEKGVVTVANQLAKSILGDPLASAIDPGKSTGPTHAPNGNVILPDALPLSRAIRLGEITTGLEINLTASDGKSIYASLTASPVRDENGRITGAVEIVQDITEHRQSLDALRISEEKFSSVFRFSPDAIAIVSPQDGSLIDVNDSLLRIFGFSRKDIHGKDWKSLNLVPEKVEREKLIEIFSHKGNVVDFELDFKTAQDRTVTLLTSMFPISVGGESLLLVIAHDITSHKQAAEALRQVQAELAAGIQERTAMEERQRLARELHDSVSQALYGIALGAHTALTLFDSDRPKVQEALNYILTQAQAGLTEMRALIFELRPESLEMEGLINAITKQTAALRARYNIQVDLYLCDEPEAPVSIKKALYRIAQEAMHNAIKHARPNRLTLKLRRESNHLTLEVFDDGQGFEPQTAYPGHLGLRSMRERATSLGGKMEIASQPGEGTHILAKIPVHPLMSVD